MFSRLSSAVRGFFGHRMAPWLWISLGLLFLVAVLRPTLLPVTLYKLALIASAAWVGYWIDRALFPYARPDAFMDEAFVLHDSLEESMEKSVPIPREQMQAFVGAQLRRAIVIAACIIGVALGA